MGELDKILMAEKADFKDIKLVYCPTCNYVYIIRKQAEETFIYPDQRVPGHECVLADVSRDQYINWVLGGKKPLEIRKKETV